MGVLKWFIVGLGWGFLNIFDKNRVQRIAYTKGYNLSQRFKRYRIWDEMVEPILIRQFAFLIGVSNAFIKGMISDNKPSKKIDESLDHLSKNMDIGNIKNKD